MRSKEKSLCCCSVRLAERRGADGGGGGGNGDSLEASLFVMACVHEMCFAYTTKETSKALECHLNRIISSSNNNDRYCIVSNHILKYFYFLLLKRNINRSQFAQKKSCSKKEKLKKTNETEGTIRFIGHNFDKNQRYQCHRHLAFKSVNEPY